MHNIHVRDTSPIPFILAPLQALQVHCTGLGMHSLTQTLAAQYTGNQALHGLLIPADFAIVLIRYRFELVLIW